MNIVAKSRKWMNNQRGMTLIELLAVVVILGIIAAIAVPAVGNAIERARVNADIANIELVKSAALNYILVGDNAIPAGGVIEVEDIQEAGFLVKVPGPLQAEPNKGKSILSVEVNLDDGKYEIDVHDTEDASGTALALPTLN